METVDTQKAGIDYKFEAHHYVWYNRYSTNGKDAPKDIDPAACQKEESSRRNNTCQNNPRTSGEKQGNLPILVQVKKAFDDVFEWIAKTLKKVLPKEYEIISQFADILPAGAISTVYPFSGFVVNFNVTTRIHQNMHNKILCVVLVISDDGCKGGDLCLLEPRIRLQMKSSDVIIFLSTKLSHFNMHYKGQRASFVFQTDAQGDQWVVDRDGWQESRSMNATDKNM
ncbi:hypothetical protein CPC08DRAFT_646289 [Agrocybe pediades]|nr:hypothetical protein CPC08DRAFT_646289 [Agrocybe pediades]